MNDEKKPTFSILNVLAILLVVSLMGVAALIAVRAGYISTASITEKIDNIFGSEGIEGNRLQLHSAWHP